jgi:hypothetical protein
MKLYYFTKSEFALAAIRQRQLKIARISDVNDPFEFLGLALRRKSARRAMRNWKSAMSERYGIVCMSSNWRHPLMWSHYADGHRGVCLGFDVSKSVDFVKVEYRSTRPTLKEFGVERVGALNEHHMRRLLHLKFDAWAYEDEYRVFTNLEEKDEKTGLYFLPFSNQFSLTKVIVGERCVVSRAEVERSLETYSNKVTSFKARAAFKDFTVTRNELDRMWQ